MILVRTGPVGCVMLRGRSNVKAAAVASGECNSWVGKLDNSDA